MRTALLPAFICLFFISSVLADSSEVEDFLQQDSLDGSFLLTPYFNADIKPPSRAAWPSTKPQNFWSSYNSKIPLFPVYTPKAYSPAAAENIESMDIDEDESGEGGEFVNLLPGFSSNLDADDLGGIFKIFNVVSGTQPWWKGQNVCMERQETDDSDGDSDELGVEDPSDKKFSVNIKTCRQTNTKYECIHKEVKSGMTKSYTIRYQCCHGFQRKEDNSCQKIELFSLIDTIKKLNGSEFLKLSDGLEDILKNENLTVFLPSDEAFKEFANKMFETNQIELTVPITRRRRNVNGISTSQLIQAHMSKGFTDISSDDVYHSLLDNSTLQINNVIHAEEPQFMVNCARIMSTNNYATAAIVHTVDRVLMPVTRTIAQILSETPKLSTLYNLLKKTGMAKSFDGSEIWTIFAPTNAAFEKLSPMMQEKLMNGDTCTINIMKHHTLSNALCSTNVKANSRLVIKNIMGELLDLTIPTLIPNNNNVDSMINDAEFLINGAVVSEADIIATNGVIHIIDEIKIPNNAMLITSLLVKHNLTKFYDAIVKAGMIEEVEKLSNVTFFVPTNKALDNYFSSEKVPDIKKIVDLSDVDDMAQESLRSFVRHHITEGAVKSCEMTDNAIKTTKDDESTVRINLYSTLPPFVNTYNRATVDCARLLHFDGQQCDNILHQIDRPLVDTEGTIMDNIKEKSEFSMLKKIISDTEIENILKTRKDLTFVAPTNKAFEKLTKADYDILLTDKEFTEKLLKQHIIDGVVCCTGLVGSWPFTSTVRAFSGNNLIINNNSIGGVKISDCDYVSENGVMHYTDSIMIPRNLRLGAKHSVDILLVGL